MRLALELIVTAVLVFVLLRLGWPWPILAMPLYLVAFSLGLPSLSRNAKVRSRPITLLVIFLTSAIFISWIIAEILFRPEVQAGIIDNSRFLRFLLSNNSLKIFWSAVIGLIVPSVLAAIVLVPYGLTVGQNMYSQYEQYKGHEREAAHSAIGVLLGIGRGTWIVSNGQAEIHGEAGGALARFGGPGKLIVQEGHAVILERSGRLSRVVGRGITWLEPFERISMVVPLNGRAERVTVENVATKDKVLIETVEVIVFHKIDPGPEDERVQDGLFAYAEQKLLDGVWSPGGGDWRNTVKSITDGAVRDVVGRYDLETLMPMSDKIREGFKEDLKRAINKTTSSALGVLTTSVDIGPMKMPDEARKRLMEKWLADGDIQIASSQREAMIRRGEADAVLMKVREIAWAEAQKQIIQRITEAFREVGVSGPGQIGYVVALRALETLEKMAADPATKILLPNEILMQLTNVHSLLLDSTPGGDGRGDDTSVRTRPALPIR